jgi:hypothetical protein
MTYDIKVVVFKDLTMEDVQRLYPIVPRKNQDFIYLEYSEALLYLDSSVAKIGQSIPQLTARLKQTKQLILVAFAT